MLRAVGAGCDGNPSMFLQVQSVPSAKQNTGILRFAQNDKPKYRTTEILSLRLRMTRCKTKRTKPSDEQENLVGGPFDLG
jgi:hypothetical protein